LSFAIAVGLAIAVASTGVLAKSGIFVDSREYKLLLDPNQFTGDAATRAAAFWESRLKPIIASRLDARDNGQSRAKKSFALDHQRRIVFRDTATCALSDVGLSYRERTKWTPASGPATSEVTLKLRGPDLFLANASRFEGIGGGKSKFEEDVSFAGDAAGPKHRFSYSVSQKGPAAAVASTLHGAIEAFPGIDNVLKTLSSSAPGADAPLLAGTAFLELVFSGAKVDLGQDTDAEFDLTFWYPADAATLDRPVVVEISYSYDTDDGAVNLGVAQRGANLFTGLVAALNSIIATGSQSKTSRALPNACRED
jgi:hypothetical protein